MVVDYCGMDLFLRSFLSLPIPLTDFVAKENVWKQASRLGPTMSAFSQSKDEMLEWAHPFFLPELVLLMSRFYCMVIFVCRCWLLLFGERIFGRSEVLDSRSVLCDLQSYEGGMRVWALDPISSNKRGAGFIFDSIQKIAEKNLRSISRH